MVSASELDAMEEMSSTAYRQQSDWSIDDYYNNHHQLTNQIAPCIQCSVIFHENYH